MILLFTVSPGMCGFDSFVFILEGKGLSLVIYRILLLQACEMDRAALPRPGKPLRGAVRETTGSPVWKTKSVLTGQT